MTKIVYIFDEIQSVWKNTKPKAEMSGWRDVLVYLNWAFPNLYESPP